MEMQIAAHPPNGEEGRTIGPIWKSGAGVPAFSIFAVFRPLGRITGRNTATEENAKIFPIMAVMDMDMPQSIL